jgi:hypothetical protein
LQVQEAKVSTGSTAQNKEEEKKNEDDDEDEVSDYHLN